MADSLDDGLTISPDLYNPVFPGVLHPSFTQDIPISGHQAPANPAVAAMFTGNPAPTNSMGYPFPLVGGLPQLPGGNPNLAPSTGGLNVVRTVQGGPDTWEMRHNNFGGLRLPGVNAGPNSGGFQSFQTPEDGVMAIAHQLDRYFSGATTGRPLTTLNDIVSTWAPSSENDTKTLISRASKVLGVAPDAQLDWSDPTVRAKLIEATIRNEQGGLLPVDSGVISKIAGADPSTWTPTQLAQGGGGTRHGGSYGSSDFKGILDNSLSVLNAHQAATPGTPPGLDDSTVQSPYMKLMMMSMIRQLTQAGTHQFTPVQYDPWKYVPQGGGANASYVTKTGMRSQYQNG